MESIIISLFMIYVQSTVKNPKSVAKELPILQSIRDGLTSIIDANTPVT